MVAFPESAARRTEFATCAICCLQVPAIDFRRESSSDSLRIVGTGFLVSPTTVITNRHVILVLRQFMERKKRTEDDLYLWFTYPGQNDAKCSFQKVKKYGVVYDADLDLGLIEFVRPADPEFVACVALTIPAECAATIGDEVAIYGFPYGDAALGKRPGDLFYRVGPVVQRGYVSAIAPWNFCPAKSISRILLDARTARGMSGGPVVRISDGSVLGIHSAGLKDEVAFAIPLHRKLVSDLIAVHRKGGSGVTQAEISVALPSPVFGQRKIES